MSIRVSCPSCGKVYNLDDGMHGKIVRCRVCQEAINVLGAPGQPAPPSGSLPHSEFRATPAPSRVPPPPAPSALVSHAPFARQPEPPHHSQRPRRDHRPVRRDNTMLILACAGGLVLLCVGLTIAGLVFALSGGAEKRPGSQVAATKSKTVSSKDAASGATRKRTGPKADPVAP